MSNQLGINRYNVRSLKFSFPRLMESRCHASAGAAAGVAAAGAVAAAAVVPLRSGDAGSDFCPSRTSERRQN